MRAFKVHIIENPYSFGKIWLNPVDISLSLPEYTCENTRLNIALMSRKSAKDYGSVIEAYQTAAGAAV
jgi:hypothetical protein